eukprot:1099249-Lingulodinium_polyedra.AAC.1
MGKRKSPATASAVASGGAKSPGDGKKRKLTVAQIVQQKLRDNFSKFDAESTDVKKDSSGMTLRERLTKDVQDEQG